MQLHNIELRSLLSKKGFILGVTIKLNSFATVFSKIKPILTNSEFPRNMILPSQITLILVLYKPEVPVICLNLYMRRSHLFTCARAQVYASSRESTYSNLLTVLEDDSVTGNDLDLLHPPPPMCNRPLMYDRVIVFPINIDHHHGQPHYLFIVKYFLVLA